MDRGEAAFALRDHLNDDSSAGSYKWYREDVLKV